jgi:hypothetical protein
MADLRLRQLEREYSLTGTQENLEALLVHYARTYAALDLLAARPPIRPDDIPFDTPYMAINYFDTSDWTPIWGPWGLEEDDCGNPDKVHPVMVEVFKDAGFSYPPPKAIDIDYLPNDEFFFIYFEPGTTRQYVASIVDALCDLGCKEAADGNQRLDNSYQGEPSPMDSIITRLTQLRAAGYPYSEETIDFLKSQTSPIWEYNTGDSTATPLPPEIVANLKAVNIPTFSLETMNFILNSPYAQSLNIVFNGTSLRGVVIISLGLSTNRFSECQLSNRKYLFGCPQLAEPDGI